jgi:Rieske Fe-S protein
MVCKIEPEWAPSPSDIAWVEGLLRMLKNDGVWACPCSMSIFTFDKKAKKYDLAGDPEDATNKKTVKILTHLGWKKK